MTECACANGEDVSKGQAGGRAGRQTGGQNINRDQTNKTVIKQPTTKRKLR